ncbi:MAG: protocatechuate 3,4-dioxygenase [Nitrosomonas sp.]|nr:protocatechuate 3,4-dioxygenase [Nitrosomonas sp.]
MKSIYRRNFIKMGLFSGVTSILTINSSLSKALGIPTPAEVEGPFYPVIDHQDKDFDLTKINGRQGVADGPHIIIKGRIADATGRPVENATIDLWQANAKGRYRHPRDSNPQPLDPNFQGWAIINSGKDGKFRFKTVKPGAYPASKTWIRPPHIHFKVSVQGYAPLITQMYFPDEKLNQMDLLLRNKKASERSLMIANHIDQEGNIEIYQYNITLPYEI